MLPRFYIVMIAVPASVLGFSLFASPQPTKLPGQYAEVLLNVSGMV